MTVQDQTPTKQEFAAPLAGTPMAREQAAKFLGLIFFAVLAWILIAVVVWLARRNLWAVSHITGYILFVVVLGLVFLKARKRLLVLPLGPVRDWLLVHFVLGALSLPLYFQHTGTLWPQGRYEQFIALFFYTASLSAIVGIIFQRVYPRRLIDLGSQVIYESIPTELANLREEAEALVVNAVRETSSDTVGRYYAESFQWYFQKPRFVLSHLLGTGRSLGWIHMRVKVLDRFLNQTEREFMHKLEAIAIRKNGLDAHYAMQGALKLWLFVHVPSAILLVLLACWHLIVVNIYS